MANFLQSMKISQSYNSKDSHLRLLYKPIELELVQVRDNNDKSFKVIKNSYFHDEKHKDDDFDKRNQMNLEGKNIFDVTNIQNDPLYQFNRTQRLNQINLSARLQTQNLQNQNHNHQGLINILLYNSNKKYQEEWSQTVRGAQTQNFLHSRNLQVNIEQNQQINESCRIKVMICVTVYSEKLQELQKTLKGIADNVKYFEKSNIHSHQILVTFIFDGIANIHNNVDENNSNYHDNIIPFFSSQIDKKYGIPEQKTLEYQYNQYVQQQKRLNDYNPENIKKLRSNQKALLEKYKKHRESLFKTMQRLRGSDFLSAEEYIEQNIIDAMNDQYKRAKIYLENRNNTAWMYQDRYFDQQSGGSMPIFYVFKFKNGSKLSSHMWFFKGFCQEFLPDYCILMDVGAKPQEDAIYRLVMAMETYPKVGGVCGTMRVEIEEEDKKDVDMDIVSNFLINKVFSIQKCQSCEYDIAHLLDKQAESTLDFIHVLPGAFSGYRYRAFSQKFGTDNPKEKQFTILDQYLKQVITPNFEHESLQEANMFLAEDRVLCKLLFCNGYYLRYIPESYVYVDPCTSLKMLLLQRRRWINGSWYALEYVINTYKQDLEKSNHDCWDKAKFIFSITQAQIQQWMIYYMESFQIVWLYMIMYSITDTGDLGLDNFINSTVVAFYVFLIFTVMYLSLNYDPALIRKLKGQSQQKQETDYYFSRLFLVSTLLGFFSLGTVVYTLYLLITEIFIQHGFNDIVDKPHVPQSYYLLLVVLSIGSLALPILLSFVISPTNKKNIFNVVFTMIPYFYYQPTYSHLFVIYSFCRIDDLSWGTKGLTTDMSSSGTVTSDKGFQKFQFLLKWIIANTIVTAILLILFQIDVFLLPQGIILCFSVTLTIFTIIKGILAFSYKFKYLCFHCKINSKIKGKQNSKNNNTNREENQSLRANQDNNTNREQNQPQSANQNLGSQQFTEMLEKFYKKQ